MRLFRRFDDVLHYELPEVKQIVALLKARLARVAEKGTSWENLSEIATGLSYAEVVRASEEVLKEALINQRERIAETEIHSIIEERQDVAGKLNKHK